MFKKWQAILQFVQETWSLGERGVKRLEHQPRAKTHNRCIFKMGSRYFSKKKEVALDCFVNSNYHFLDLLLTSVTLLSNLPMCYFT